MKRRAQQEQKKRGEWKPSGEPLLKGCPAIDRYMSDAWYDDGKARDVSKLTITLTGNGVGIVLTDPDERSSAFTQGETVQDCLDLLEAALGDAKRDPWRPWPKSFGKKS